MFKTDREIVENKTYCIWQWNEITQEWEFVSSHKTESDANRRIYDWMLWRQECKVIQTTESLH